MQRLETDKLKEILKEADIDFVRLENDEDAREILKTLDYGALKEVLNECFKTHNINYDQKWFNNRGQRELESEFFNNFDVYPKATGKLTPEAKETSEASKEITENVMDSAEYERLKGKTFPYGLNAPYEVDYEVFTDCFNEKADGDDKLFEIMEKESPNVGKAFKKCAEAVNLKYKSGQLVKFKNDTPKLFFEVFKVIYTDQPLPKQGTNSGTTEKASYLVFKEAKPVIETLVSKNIFEDAEKLGFEVHEIDILKDFSITVKNGLWFKIPENSPINMNVAFILRADDKALAAVGHIEDGLLDKDLTRPHIIALKSDMDFNIFEGNTQFLACFLPYGENLNENAGKIYALPVKLKLKELETTDIPLCVDFGTSNTTAGIFLSGEDEFKLVKFLDVTKTPPILQDMIPTTVYVDSVENGKTNYKFGYEAQKELIDSDYDTGASFFFEIKRWIGSLDDKIEIEDKKGRTLKVTRKSVIKAYLEHIIDAASVEFQLKFKKLHFTAPVKLKSVFLEALREREMFPEPEYTVESEHSIDEGFAIAYDYISKKVKDNHAEGSGKKLEGRVFVIDCGGGTTDLASSHYIIEETPIGPSLKIMAGFENGDSNYGGNNITYRILQMLKIKIAHSVKNNEENKDIDMHNLINEEESDILSAIDNGGGSYYKNRDGIYKDFDAMYNEAENIIPTKFLPRADLSSTEIRRIKRNYYYLWKMAESIKIEFYESSKRVDMSFEKEEDKTLLVPKTDEYHLWMRVGDNSLKDIIAPMDKLKITIKEVNTILRPDIYALLSTLLMDYEDDILRGNFQYCLSGQSCKINLFKDLLKEFIPGRKIRPSFGKTTNKASATLKKYCIEGALSYMKDIAHGKIDSSVSSKVNYIYDVKNEEKTLLSCGKITKDGIAWYPSSVSEVIFKVFDKNQRELNRICYVIKAKYPFDEKESIAENLKKCIETSSSADKETVDQIMCDLMNKELKSGYQYAIFVLPAKLGYGFCVFQVAMADKMTDKNKKKRIYSTPYNIPDNTPPTLPEFFGFEKEELITFFGGDK